MLIEANSRLVFIGDSITDAGRDKNLDGEGRGTAYGGGYVNLIHAHMMTTYPERRIRSINMGISGNTVRDLDNRWQRDVTDKNPDWLSIMIGINDVWRQFDMAMVPECQVHLDEYKETLTRLVSQTRPTVKGMVLATPYFIESVREDAMRVRMDQYGAVVKELASEYDCILVDTQAAFDHHLQYFHSANLGWDRVHQSSPGHMIIAKAWLQAVGYSW